MGEFLPFGCFQRKTGLFREKSSSEAVPSDEKLIEAQQVLQAHPWRCVADKEVPENSGSLSGEVPVGKIVASVESV